MPWLAAADVFAATVVAAAGVVAAAAAVATETAAGAQKDEDDDNPDTVIAVSTEHKRTFLRTFNKKFRNRFPCGGVWRGALVLGLCIDDRPLGPSELSYAPGPTAVTSNLT